MVTDSEKQDKRENCQVDKMISPGRAVAYLLIGLLVMVFAGKKGGLA